MPIDPSLILGSKPVELESPVDTYMKGLQIKNAMQQNQASELALQDARINSQEAAGLRNYLKSNPNTNSNEFGQNLLKYGKSGESIAKAISDRQTADLTRKKDKDALITTALARQREELGGTTTPDELKQVIARSYQDPTLKEYFESRGATLEQSLAHVDQANQNGQFANLLLSAKIGVKDALKNHYVARDLGDRSQIDAVPEYGTGPVATVKGSQQAIGLSPNKSVTNVYNNVNTKGEGAYAEQTGKLQATDDNTLHKAAKSSQSVTDTAQRIIDLVDSGKVYTGAGADTRLLLGKWLGIEGKDSNEKVVNTELLISNLAKSTLAAVKDSGLGTGQGFTDKDLDFVKSASAGTIGNNSASIRRLAKISQKVAAAKATEWNDRLVELGPKRNVANLQPVQVPKYTLAPKGVNQDHWDAMSLAKKKKFYGE